MKPEIYDLRFQVFETAKRLDYSKNPSPGLISHFRFWFFEF